MEVTKSAKHFRSPTTKSDVSPVQQIGAKEKVAGRRRPKLDCSEFKLEQQEIFIAQWPELAINI